MAIVTKSFPVGSISDVSPSTTEFDTDLSSAVDDIYVGYTIVFYGATETAHISVVSDYDGTNKTISVSPALPVAPSDGDNFMLIPWGLGGGGPTANVNVVSISGDSTAADNLEAACDGDGYDIGGIDVSELNSIVDDLLDAGRLDALIDAIKAKTDGLPASPAAVGSEMTLEDDAITAAKIASDAIGASEIADGAIDAGAIASGAIDDDALASDTDTYQAKVWLIDDDGAGTPTDRYVVVFYKNSQPVTSGITSPTIWVFSMAASPADLVGTSGSAQALTQAGATGTYFHDETSNRIADGTAYLARVQATIGGSTRTWYQPVGRDS